MRVEKARALATFVPSTWDPEKRTIDVVVSTGAAVRRYDWWHGEYYDEELVIADDAIRMERLNNGAAVLNVHSQWDLGDQIGVVERAWVEDGKLMATLRLSARDDIAGIVQDIADGIIRNISVGYIVHVYEKLEKAGTVPVWRAIDWEPTEVSFVTVPADAGAQTRSASPQTRLYDVRVIESTATPPATGGSTQQEENPMTTPALRGGAPASDAQPPQNEPQAVQPDQTRNAPAVDTRASEILKAVGAAGFDLAFARQLIDSNATLDQARAQIIDKLAANDVQVRTNGAHSGVSVTRDEGDTRIRGMENALILRINPRATLDKDGIEMARAYRHMSMLRMAEESLVSRGVNVRGLSPLEISTRALHSTSDFPLILSALANKRLRGIYEGVPTTYQHWARRGPNAPNFKDVNIVQISAAPDLQKIAEAGELKYGTLKEGGVTARVYSYYGGIGFTRQALINDDLRAFDTIMVGFAASAKRLENRLVYNELTANPAMADGVSLFHADHGNLAGAGAIAVATLGAGRAAMRKQVGLQGEILNITPSFLIVPSDLEQLAYQYTSSQFVPAKSTDVNEFRSGGRTALEPIVEPVLDLTSSTQWYLAGDGVTCDTVEYFYLEGSEGVNLESEIDFDTDGLKLRARLDFGTKVVDHRGLFRNG
jgi:hypothetical protein